MLYKGLKIGKCNLYDRIGVLYSDILQPLFNMLNMNE